MSDTSTRIHQMKESLREELADAMIVALREQAGIFLSSDEYYRAKEKFMDALRGIVTI